jgi:DNA-binding response OmpR family regulator
MKPILVLDDYASITKMLQVQLEAHGYTAVPFNTPEAALEFLENAENKLSMLIVDLYMPNINGLDFVVKLRDIAHHKFTPVAFLTSETSESIRKVTLNMSGVYEFVTKPIDTKKLLYTIKNCMV